METANFNTMVQLFAQLSRQVEALAIQMEKLSDAVEALSMDIKNIRQEMKIGLGTQTALSKEILDVVSLAFENLEQTTQETKRLHGLRLDKIEHKIGLA